MKSKKSFLINGVIFLFLTIPLFGCAKETVTYDKTIKNFKFEKAAKKVAIGILYFVDSRSPIERLGIEEGVGKNSLTTLVTKLAEEMLLRSDSFSSVSIITNYDLPDFYDEKSIEKFKKKYEVDYVLGGEILEAKIVKVEKSASFKYKASVFLSKGIVPESYDYVAKVKLRGKLISLKDGKVVWEGEGNSNFLKEGMFLKKENVLMAGLHNALGKMLSDMSKIFSLTIKELE